MFGWPSPTPNTRLADATATNSVVRRFGHFLFGQKARLERVLPEREGGLHQRGDELVDEGLGDSGPERELPFQMDRSEEGFLVLAGPFTDHPAGMAIIKAIDKEQASKIAEADPFVREGVRSYSVRTSLLSTEENHYLGSAPTDIEI